MTKKLGWAYCKAHPIKENIIDKLVADGTITVAKKHSDYLVAILIVGIILLASLGNYPM